MMTQREMHVQKITWPVISFEFSLNLNKSSLIILSNIIYVMLKNNEAKITENIVLMQYQIEPKTLPTPRLLLFIEFLFSKLDFSDIFPRIILMNIKQKKLKKNAKNFGKIKLFAPKKSFILLTSLIKISCQTRRE
jgi:hypothetical protein